MGLTQGILEVVCQPRGILSSRISHLLNLVSLSILSQLEDSTAEKLGGKRIKWRIAKNPESDDQPN